MTLRSGWWMTVLALSCAGPLQAADPPPAVADALKTIRAVTREGAGNDAAAKAWKVLVAQGSSALVPTLAAFDGVNPTVANWLRTATDAIAEAEKAAKKPLPMAELKAFILNGKNPPAARRIAYELATGADAALAKELLPQFQNDPDLELRRDSIQYLWDGMAKAPAAPEVLKLFRSARDKDQVEMLAQQLENLKSPVNITKHYGYITEWYVVGPFPSPLSTGFSKPYPPEKADKVNLTAEYEGNAGSKVKWVYAQSDQTYGTVDLNAALGKHKDSAAYATASIVSETETPAEIRAATKNAIKIFVNGQEAFAREEYHHGLRMDQHVARVTLKKGRNEIVLKICQNNQTESWAQDWTLACRICDATGGALPLKQIISKAGQEDLIDLGALKPATKKEEKK